MHDTSRSQLKSLLELHHSRTRRELALVLVPGFKCLDELLLSRWPLREVYLTDSAAERLPAPVLRRLQRDDLLWRIHESDAVKLAAQPAPEGIIALAECPAELESRDALMAAQGPQLLLDGLADPGNLGSVIRTAAWFGIRRIGLVGACADVGNTKVLRASMGAVFRLSHAVRLDEGDLANLAGSHRLIGLDGAASTSLDQFHFQPGDVLVMGSESHGLGDSRPHLGLSLAIPGAGSVESLNVGHAFAVAAWEQFRQGSRD